MDGVYDVIIIGSGPAGLTAALYTARAGLKTLVVAGSGWGGQLMLTTLVENYPGFPDGIMGPELMERMRKQAERFGAKIEERDVIEIETEKRPLVVKTDEAVYQSRAIVIATGALAQWLGVPGEERLIGRGVSSCAPCDAPFFKDKRVVVVGGGDSAMEEALVLTKFAKEVTVVHRRDKFRASAVMQKKVFDLEKKGKIKIMWDSEVTEFVGENKLEK